VCISLDVEQPFAFGSGFVRRSLGGKTAALQQHHCNHANSRIVGCISLKKVPFKVGSVMGMCPWLVDHVPVVLRGAELHIQPSILQRKWRETRQETLRLAT
jgi:hypothetical protein